MDNIILGLLLMKSRTIYELKERINKGLHLMYSNSMGSIQAAIKKLLARGDITYEEVVENGRHKKCYTITEQGKQHFFAWVHGPIKEQTTRVPELTKVYFMGFSDKEHRTSCIQQHIAFLKQQYQTLDVICKEAEHVSIPEKQKDIVRYQLASARYGRDFMKFNIEWYEQLLREIRRE